MNINSNIPFLRILFPFVAGITLALCEISLPVLILLMACTVILLVTLHYSPACKLNFSKFLIAGMDLTLMSYGFLLVPSASVLNHPLYYGKKLNTDSVVRYVAVINDIPEQKSKSVKCRLKLSSIIRNDSLLPVHGEIIAYFKNSQLSSILKPNQVLIVDSKLTEVPPPLNPDQFDYRAYLKNKQICHVTFVDSSHYRILDIVSSSDKIWQSGLSCKQYVLNSLKEGGLSRDAYGICSALLTGYDADIDQGVMESFSHSGTLHVLSVSGLHTGLIYLVLSFLFDLADRRQKRKILKFIFITFFLWGFALVAGFSAPVLRAVIMFNLLGMGKIFFRSGTRHQVNILCVSAFILLNLDPFLLRDVGFLLSYFAMAGLFCFQPPLSSLWTPPGQLSMYCWQSITASFAATISTLPITLFFFKQFPIWFFVCNLVVVPATFLLLLLALLVVMKLGFVSVVINYSVAWLIVFIDLFDSDRFGYIDYIHFTAIDLLFLSAVITLFSFALVKRSYSLSRALLITIITWQLISIPVSFLRKDQKLLSVYQIRYARAITLKNRSTTHLLIDDSTKFNFQLKPHINTFNYPLILKDKFNYVRINGTGILLVDKPGVWIGPLMPEVTILVISNNFRINEKMLASFPSLGQVVIDGSNNQAMVSYAAELCRKLELRFYDTRKEGACLLTLK